MAERTGKICCLSTCEKCGSEDFRLEHINKMSAIYTVVCSKCKTEQGRVQWLP